MNNFCSCYVPASPLFLVTLVGFPLWITHGKPIFIPYVLGGVDLTPGCSCLNNQNSSCSNLIGIGIKFMCFFTNEIKGDFYWGFWKKELYSLLNKFQPKRPVAIRATGFFL